MLIDFAVTNFRSIKERQVFSMQTVGKVTEHPDNVIKNNKYNLVRSVILYGRNASGKSNLLLAIEKLRYIIAGKNSTIIDVYNPYKLESLDNNIEFEINFIANDGIEYNYLIAFNAKEIITEKLYFYPGKKRAKLFLREFGKPISLGENFKDNITDIEKQLYPFQSLLSRVAIYKLESLIPPFEFFSKNFIPLSIIDKEDSLIKLYANAILEGKLPNYLDNINKLMRIADTGINYIEISENKEKDFNFPNDIDEKLKNFIIEKNKFQIYTNHFTYKNGKKNGSIKFKLDEESAGTIKLLTIGLVILECLHYGDILFIDELDKGLHPKLTKALINIFNNPKTNSNNAQLIFASHDVSLLNSELFRRDQIWFAEKEMEGNSTYYSLADLKGIRQNIPYEKYYMKGAFGAVPVINEYDFDFKFNKNEQKSNK